MGRASLRGVADRPYVLDLADEAARDASTVGGKNAALAEMIQRLGPTGVRVPPGFATTAFAYWHFLDANELREPIALRLRKKGKGGKSLRETGRAIRRMIERADMPEDLSAQIARAYLDLGAATGAEDPDVAVRSSATAEDLPHASFAGQQETYLNVTGADDLVDACRRCFASLFTDRAIHYREEQGFDHESVALSIGVQKMVRSDLAGAGVLFTLDPETGFRKVVLINASFGLGETVVQGSVDPDQYVVFKPLLEDEALCPIVDQRRGEKAQHMVYAKRGPEPTRTVDTKRRDRERMVLSQDEILKLARWGVTIERHYDAPMDVEWAKDGETGELLVVQARPETVQSRRKSAGLETWRIDDAGEVLCRGLAVGSAVAAGPVRALRSASQGDRLEEGAILVTERTDPDWVPLMKRAAAIVTDHGGRTSHAAIVSRELGVPAVVGAGDATQVLKTGREVTVNCAEGEEGLVHDGIAAFESTPIDPEDVPETETRVMLNLANPGAAFRWAALPADGVGLLRLEFLIGNGIQVHPMALVHPDRVKDREARRRIRELTRGYDDPAEYFVDRLAWGIARIAAAWHPKPVIVRTSDFKTNEYAELVGGAAFEREEANPMLGVRGASRYYAERYREGFALECRALQRVRETLGLENVVVMIPFCRTVAEADRVLGVLAEHGLQRGRHGLEVYCMTEVPSNVLLAERFAERFDGFSIGSNDLTQLVLGVDRDAEELEALYDEADEAVRTAIRQAVEAAHRGGITIGFCGQAPSDDPEFAGWLSEVGIDSVSVTPDSFARVKDAIAAFEATRRTSGSRSRSGSGSGSEEKGEER